MAVKNYDPSGVVLIFGSIITGYSSGTFIKASRNEDTFKLVVGADGLPTRVRNRNSSGRIEVTIQQTSSSNSVLSALYSFDEATGEGTVPVLLKDLNGSALVSADEGWIIKPADPEYGADLTDRTWTIEMGEMAVFL